MPLSPGKRAQSLAEMGEVLERMFVSDANLEPCAPYTVRRGDVIITPYGKCGTTMMQQMFHQLRTAHRGGDMAFDDISRVVPWIETAPQLGIDINAEQVAEPRGFKSHLAYEDLPPGARYVITLRDPKEAFVSMYHFFSGWIFEPGSISLSEFLPVWTRRDGGRKLCHEHLISWWARRGEADTLVMDYRSVLADKRAAIRRLADFCDLPMTEPVIDMVEERTSRAFMMEHKAPFEDAMMRAMSEHRGGLPSNSDSAKIRASDAERGGITPEMDAELDALWEEIVTPATGHADYASLAAAL